MKLHNTTRMEHPKIALLGDANSINVLRWREGLTRAGAEVHIFSIHINTSSDPEFHAINAPRLPGMPEKLRYFTAINAAKKEIAKLQPDLLIGYFITGYGTLSALSGFRPLVQITSGEDILTAPSNPAMRILVKNNLRQADLIVAWAPHMADAVRSLGFRDNKIMTLPRGIPLEGFRNCRSKFPEETIQPIRILSTRSLYPIYNIDKKILAISALRERGYNCSLTIVGDGPLRPQLEALTYSLGMSEWISFFGRVPNQTLPTLLAEHDLYLSLVMFDGVSASLLEAMAASVFPIVYDHPANRYWIEHGKNGLLVNKLDSEHVAETISQAIDNTNLRRDAWGKNRELVHARADLWRNSEAYMVRFRRLIDMSD